MTTIPCLAQQVEQNSLTSIEGTAWTFTSGTAGVAFYGGEMYLFGRSVAKILIGTMSVFITIMFGVLFLKVYIDLAAGDWA